MDSCAASKDSVAAEAVTAELDAPAIPAVAASKGDENNSTTTATAASSVTGHKRGLDDEEEEGDRSAKKSNTTGNEDASAASSSEVPNAPIDVDVVTYNVLSSHLASPDHFKSNDPQFLKADYRFELVKAKLQVKIDAGSVICLQEISTQWAGKLHVFFVARGYYFISCHYGKKFNGNMGIAIAVPMNKFDIVDVDITTVSYTKWLPRAPAPGLVDKVSSAVLGALKLVKLYTPPRENPWNEALWRNNQMVMVRLRAKAGIDGAPGRPFVVGTYHMPCMFQVPQVMVIHCALSAQLIHRFAKGDPYIYVGDFNVKPESSMYSLLTNGTLDPSHPEYPHNVPGDNYELKVTPLRSAYREAGGAEPNFTNYAKPGDADTFIDTLDYIFLSDHWSVGGVDALPHRDEVAGPLPNKEEPSDHLLLAARVTA